MVFNFSYEPFIISAYYNGLKLTETELNNLNENRDFVHDCIMDSIF